jgi:hypothetical protein
MIVATGGLPCMRRGPRRPRYALCTAWVPASPASQVESAVWADRIGRCQQTAAAARQRKSPEPCRRLVCPGTNPGLSRSRSSASAKSATEKPAGTARRGARNAARTQDLTTPRRRLYECRSEAVARRRSRSGTIPIVSKRCEPSTATTAKQVYWLPSRATCSSPHPGLAVVVIQASAKSRLDAIRSPDPRDLAPRPRTPTR